MPGEVRAVEAPDAPGTGERPETGTGEKKRPGAGEWPRADVLCSKFSLSLCAALILAGA